MNVLNIHLRMCLAVNMWIVPCVSRVTQANKLNISEMKPKGLCISLVYCTLRILNILSSSQAMEKLVLKFCGLSLSL